MEQIYTLILTYKYAILLPLVMVGGPIVPVIAGSLAALGILDVFIAYAVSVTGTVTGDTIYYWIGRVARHTFIARFGHYMGITEAKIVEAEHHFDKHLGKTLFFAKITEAAVVVALLAAGAAKVNFRKFFSIVALIEIFKILMFILIGYYFGKYYVLISQYIDTSAAIGFAVIVASALVYWFFLRKKPQLI